MATRKQKAALLLSETLDDVKSIKTNGLENREEQIHNQQHKHSHQPVAHNSLKIKLDHLKTISALTDNQQKFFDMYKRGDYCIGVLGSAGTGKTFISTEGDETGFAHQHFFLVGFSAVISEKRHWSGMSLKNSCM